ncbi:hypothetical protein [Actinophytocola glycyrrhizae]|uniref:DUF2336 domain-containing protein n=1 Tax=Actinophytocola glycyrrhizae TaxID=2044873 RepID=A0ABV9RUS8_9PSEU
MTAGTDLATRAELVKLARALGTTTDTVSFAAVLPHEDIRRVRERVVTTLYDEHRAAFQRVAAITRVLPTAVNVRIALRAFTPLLAARVAGEMTPDRAAELADRMPVGYLTEACLHLDPRRAGPLVQRLRPGRLLAVVAELIDRAEYITLGRLLDAATEGVIHDVAMTVSTEALLRIGLYAESGTQLTRAVALLPPARLRGVVRDALSGEQELMSAGLALIGRLTDDELRARLAGYAAKSDTATLVALLHTAIADDTVPALLTAVAALGADDRRRVLRLPTPEMVDHLVPAVKKHNLWDTVAELTPHMPDDLRHRFTTACRRLD